MKAIVCTRYGPPQDVLKLEEVPRPVPKAREVLVKVHASSLNAADFEILSGVLSARIIGPFRPLHKIPGSDVAGTVEEVGRSVKRFKPGDEVFGDLFMSGHGAFAEYTCALESAVVPKPAGLTFEDAATLPQAAIISLQGLRGKRDVEPGQKVMIIGAGGGMGTFAVQIAKTFGADVTGVDSGKKLDMLRSLGADHVIDYTNEDFTRSGKQYDLIMDVAAHRSVLEYKRMLGPDGIFVIVGGTKSAIFQTVFIGPLVTMAGDRKMGLNPWKPNDEKDLGFILKLIEEGKVRPVIDRRYPLSEVPQALQYLKEGRALGKLVITLEHNDKT